MEEKMMQDYPMTFKRYEIKYLLSDKTYEKLWQRLEGNAKTDKYGNTTICNVYFDTPDSRLIRTSLEKPVYKEKLRLRSYGTPHREGMVFVELKKKYQGVVYKRRETMVLSEAEDYLLKAKQPGVDSQVLREIDWFLKYYRQLQPAMYISYERIAMYGIKDPSLRITFDRNILWRDKEINLQKGSWGWPILKPGERLMEIKIAGAMPLWLSRILNELQIYPVSFSKYGRAYQAKQMQISEKKGGKNCA